MSGVHDKWTIVSWRLSVVGDALGTLQVCMDETADVLLAYKMNGEELTPDHGYPIRLIVPGYIGGRMVSLRSTRNRARTYVSTEIGSLRQKTSVLCPFFF